MEAIKVLISFLLRASAFGATRITGKLSAAAARQLLQDILDAGIVVDFPDGRMLTAVEGHIEQLEPQFKQRLLILLEEIKKQRKSIVATPASGRGASHKRTRCVTGHRKPGGCKRASRNPSAPIHAH